MPRLGLPAFFGIVVATVLSVQASSSSAQSFAPPPAVTLRLVASGLSSPLGITHAGDGSGRLFIVEKGGRIKILENGALLPTPFLDISSRISTSGERGLLGLAFHPLYGVNGRFFVFYTRASDGALRVSSFRVSSGDPDLADQGSEQQVITIAHPADNHNGGQIAFGRDGYLYVAVGDGGGAGDTANNAQTLSVLLGKILRLDVSNASGYTIPAGNPFVSTPGARAEIWAYGVRNPWRFSFDRATADLLIADVGQNATEEVNYQAAGAPGGRNYGWRIFEGNGCFNPPSGCSLANHTPPVLQYGHNSSGGNSITGGYVYRGSRSAALRGYYLYGDYVSNRVWAAQRIGSSWQTYVLIAPPSVLSGISSFGEDESGEIYVASFNTGTVHAIDGPPPAAVTSADVNRDGHPDIVWRNGTAGQVYAWFMNGKTNTGAAFMTSVSPQWSLAATADFDGNGTPDLLWHNQNTGDVYVWYMDGSSNLGAAYIATVPAVWRLAATPDINGDGRTDLVWHNQSTGDVYAWLMNGATSIGAAFMGTVPVVWTLAATPDIDGDGRADILWHNQATGDVYAYFMNGTAFVAAAYVMTVQPVWRLAGTPDVNGDGKPDILWHNQSTGDVYVHFMSGVTNVGAAYLFTVDPVWKAITARAPVNGTPAPDFTIAAAPGSQTVTQGNSTNYTVTIGATDGFAGAVSLGAGGLPANATASFAPSSVTASGTATMTVTTAANTPTGSATLTITGTSGSLTHNTTVSLAVTAATFSLSGVISPPAGGGSATVNLGGASTATVTADSSGTYVFNGLANGLYTVTPGKAGFTFTPSSRSVTISGGNVTGVDFTATPTTISITSPGQGATVSNAFSITASASAGVVGVQFRVDGQNVGPEDTSAPFSTAVTAPAGSHALTAVARDASGNTVTSGMVNVTVSAAGGTALTVNGAQTFQTIDGFGVNANSLSWKNGELRPAIDMLVDQLGATIWRVVFDMEDWENPNDNADPNTPDWTYYNGLYSNAKFQNLWGTLRYLNQKGITTGITVSFMGRVPAWMGGSVIQSSMEDEWVEMMATLFFYARNTENVQFDMIDPLNEPDWDGLEGPRVDSGQYTRLLEKLSMKLDAMGLSALRFVGPNTAQIGTGVNDYMPGMMSSAVVMSKVDHFAFHNYAGDSGGADAAVKSSPYPGKNFWITEVSNAWDIMSHIGQNPAATLVWDAYDSVYNHAILAGRGTTPPNDVGNGPPLLQYNTATGTYTPRSAFYEHAQIFKFVPRGSVRIGATESNANLQMYAFRHQASGRVTIVGRNSGGSTISVNGALSGLPAVGTLQFYQTSGGDFFQRGSDAVVTDGAFVFRAPANSFFTLTSP